MLSEKQGSGVQALARFAVAVKQCARCGENHPWVEFNRFARYEIEGVASHWGTCPVLQEPILMELRPKPPSASDTLLESTREPEPFPPTKMGEFLKYP